MKKFLAAIFLIFSAKILAAENADEPGKFTKIWEKYVEKKERSFFDFADHPLQHENFKNEFLEFHEKLIADFQFLIDAEKSAEIAAAPAPALFSQSDKLNFDFAQKLQQNNILFFGIRNFLGKFLAATCEVCTLQRASIECESCR